MTHLSASTVTVDDIVDALDREGYCIVEGVWSPDEVAEAKAALRQALDENPAKYAAAVGGPIGLIRDGDIIEIDAVKGTLDVKLSADELAKRKSQWKARESDFGSGYLWKYAQQVGPAVNGAVTHPGGAAEKECYADT